MLEEPLSQWVAWHGIAYLFAALASVPVYAIVDRVWKAIFAGCRIRGEMPSREHSKLLSAALGLLERLLFLGAILADGPWFVGFWIGVKVAGGWSYWSRDYDVYQDQQWKKVDGRTLFNIHLFGSALNVLVAGMLAQTVMLGVAQKHQLALSVLGVLVLVLLVLVVATSVWLQRSELKLAREVNS